jgi:hypothetical protein
MTERGTSTVAERIRRGVVVPGRHALDASRFDAIVEWVTRRLRWANLGDVRSFPGIDPVPMRPGPP